MLICLIKKVWILIDLDCNCKLNLTVECKFKCNMKCQVSVELINWSWTYILDKSLKVELISWIVGWTYKLKYKFNL